MKSRWMTRKGRQIFYCDYSGLKADLATPRVEADAVVGVEGIVKVLAPAVRRVAGRGLTRFSDAEAAKDWLAADR